MYKFIIQIYYTNLLHKFIIQIYYTNLIHKFIILIYYSNLVYKFITQIYYTNLLYEFIIKIYYTNLLYNFSIQIYYTNIFSCLPLGFLAVFHILHTSFKRNNVTINSHTFHITIYIIFTTFTQLKHHIETKSLRISWCY